VVNATHRSRIRQTSQQRPFTYRAARTFQDVSGKMVGDLVERVLVHRDHIRQRERDEKEVKGYYAALDYAEYYAANHTSK